MGASFGARDGAKDGAEVGAIDINVGGNVLSVGDVVGDAVVGLDVSIDGAEVVTVGDAVGAALVVVDVVVVVGDGVSGAGVVQIASQLASCGRFKM